MRILAIESSAKSASAAILQEDLLEGISFQNTGLTHSRTLMPIIRDLLKNTGRSMQDMDAVAAAIGPGSFTGLRIGAATAKGLVWASGKRALGVSTLEAMAYQFMGSNVVLCCVMDARRSEVYNALFDWQGEQLTRLTPDRAIALDALKLELLSLREKTPQKQILLVGDGAHLCYNQFKNELPEIQCAPPHLVHQTAFGVAMAASIRLRASGGSGISSLNPVYLRKSQAERERA